MILGSVQAHILSSKRIISGSRYLAVSSGGETLASTNGLYWVTYPNSVPQVPNSDLVYGNGRFISAINQGAAIPTPNLVYSSDTGFTWVSSSITTKDRFVRYAYGNNVFVLMSTLRLNPYSKNQYYSSNGTSWTSMSLLPADDVYSFREVYFNSGYFISGQINFVGLPSTISTVELSTDGTSWTSSTLPVSSSDGWRTFAGPSRLFAVDDGNSSNFYISTNNGSSWSLVTSTGCPFFPIPKLYGFGVYLTWDLSNIYYSSNGYTWTSTSNTHSLSEICVGDGVFLGISSNGSTIATSPDGATWSLVTSSGPNISPGTITGIAYG